MKCLMGAVRLAPCNQTLAKKKQQYKQWRLLVFQGGEAHYVREASVTACECCVTVEAHRTRDRSQSLQTPVKSQITPEKDARFVASRF